MKKKLIFLIIILINLGSCAKPTVVDISTPNDKNLNCDELSDEFNETRRFKKEAQNVKEINSGGNMTRTILFWPALLKTLHNADVAIKAADARAYHIVDIMKDKKCENAGKLYSELNKTISITLSFEIKRLNQLYKRGIITEEEFIEAKKKILSKE
tara:strand:+ start:271 stop:738 length:468 start_codon:yes stop_codon:yes gene_type:complete